MRAIPERFVLIRIQQKSPSGNPADFFVV